MQRLSMWKQNVIVFKDTPLPEVIKILNRWYNVEFKVEDENVLKYVYTLTSDNTLLEKVLMDLEKIAPVKFEYNEDKKGVCFYEVSEICRENGLKAGCVACAVRIRSDLPSGKTCRECFFLCHRSTDLIYSWLLHLLRFSISVVAAWSIGWNWAGGLCGVVPVCPVPRNRRTYQRKPT